jgi:hypothetical protein
MKRLHTSYSNLGSWRTIRDESSGEFRIGFDQRRGIYTAIILFALCIGGSVWLAGLDTDAGNDGARIAGAWLLGITGLAVPVGILLYGRSASRRGDYLRYSSGRDLLELPQLGQSIQRAKERVYFSSEHFTDNNHHFFELNLVLDGERVGFLSSSVANGFKPVARTLEQAGFAVNHQKIKIR